MKELLDGMFERKVIEPSQGSWSSPVVLLMRTAVTIVTLAILLNNLALHFTIQSVCSLGGIPHPSR